MWIAAFFTGTLGVQEGECGTLYFSNSSVAGVDLRRLALDGGTPEVIWQAAVLDYVPGVVLAPRSDDLYWTVTGTQGFPHVIRRRNDANVILYYGDCSDHPLGGIAIDEQLGRLYWATSRNGGVIVSAGLDGENPQDLVIQAGDHVRGVAVDPNTHYVYWVECTLTVGTMRRTSPSGGVIEQVLGELDCPVDLAFSDSGTAIFWSEPSAGRIRRLALAPPGSPTDVVVGLAHPLGIAISGSRLFWAESGYLRSARLDGTDIVTLAEGINPSVLDVAGGMTTAAVPMSWDRVKALYR